MRLGKILNLLRNSKNLFKSMWREDPHHIVEFSSNSSWRINESSGENKDKRIVKKPVDIFEEIISEKPKVNLNDLDGQIKLIKERVKVLKQNLRNVNTEDETQALGYLKARKKYLKHKDKFKWVVTNRELIDKLCKKYKVMLVGINNYYKTIPREGVDEIKKFGEALSYIHSADPTFKLIVDEGGKETKKDPILLAASPFGNWWYILGAWDKEVEIVDKLVYAGK